MPPPLTRSGQARVSFREPISSSYSVEEDDDDEEEEGEEEERLQVTVETKQTEDDDGEVGGFGSRLHLQQGIPPQMDLLGKQNPWRFCVG